MKHTLLAWSVSFLALALTLTSCDNDTGVVGVYPQQDAISNSESSFDVYSWDSLNTVVPASSSVSYLGRVIDPETGKAVAASFAAQFHTFENYAFPEEAQIIRKDGLYCKSIEIHLFIRSVFGDKNNPMKLEVLPLSQDAEGGKLMEEDMTFHTNTDLMQFVNDGEMPIATKMFTATDYAVSEADRVTNDYSDNIRIVLPAEEGHRIIQTYYSHPEYFRDSYSFIRKVCPGFLFRTTSGTGTMLNLEVSTIDLIFNYKEEQYPDSVFEGHCRFAATPEVIQSTQFDSGKDEELEKLKQQNIKDGCTMLKTPAGICTELKLPVKEIYQGHAGDSISRASMTIMRLNNDDEVDDNYALGIPKTLLMVRKQNIESFFRKHQVADNQQSFTTEFQPIYNSYSFNNLSRLVSYCQYEKLTGMKKENLTEAEWEAAHPDWDRVVLIPVTTTTATDSYGMSTQVSCNQDLSLCSTRLVRGTKENPIKMQVIYSRFAGK